MKALANDHFPDVVPISEERGDDERALHAALAEGIAQDDADDTVDADEVLARLRAL